MDFLSDIRRLFCDLELNAGDFHRGLVGGGAVFLGRQPLQGGDQLGVILEVRARERDGRDFRLRRRAQRCRAGRPPVALATLTRTGLAALLLGRLRRLQRVLGLLRRQ
jgi:hypothetical protein